MTRIHRSLLALLLLAVAGLWSAVQAQDPQASIPEPGSEQSYRSIDPLRRGALLENEPEAAPMAKVENADQRRLRAWPEQPPTIPHAIDGYQLDKNSNRCLLCHSRQGAQQFQAPMLSVTHFMDRDGQVLAEVSARRYFCNQCHVVQTDAPLLVGNGFTDVLDVVGPVED